MSVPAVVRRSSRSFSIRIGSPLSFPTIVPGAAGQGKPHTDGS